jgi:BirA family biotin operon repressor/biotin-[acetyl-CoA-carboxylase] ligase
VGARIDCHASVPSTMTLADERLRAEGAAAAHGSIILAESQSGGIGRRGRSWLSPPQGNLYFSLLWAPMVHSGGDGAGGPMAFLPQLSQLNLAASVAVVNAAGAVGVESTARIKWPNDVWAGSPKRKLSGTILNFDGKEAAVLGVGINVAQDLSANATATSLQTLSNQLNNDESKAVEREAVLAAFCGELERLMSLSPAAVLDEYSRVDLLKGRTVRVHHKTREETDERDFDALALGVSAEGALRVRPLEPPNAAVRELSGEEVSISPLNLEAHPKEEL